MDHVECRGIGLIPIDGPHGMHLRFLFAPSFPLFSVADRPGVAEGVRVDVQVSVAIVRRRLASSGLATCRGGGGVGTRKKESETNEIADVDIILNIAI
ncbi:hypothetical protein EJB05_35196, partial [Eragrostis curvula]